MVSIGKRITKVGEAIGRAFKKKPARKTKRKAAKKKK